MKKIMAFFLVAVIILVNCAVVCADDTTSGHPHCYCGGELTLGAHTKHKSFGYIAWNGVNAIPYKGDVCGC